MVLQNTRHFHKMTTVPPSSPIQTILSALEFHQILHTKKVARGLEKFGRNVLQVNGQRLQLLLPPVGNYTLPRR